MEEETSRINISIPTAKKREWDLFAKRIGQSFSGLARLAIGEYVDAANRKNGVPGAESFSTLERILSQKLDEKVELLAAELKKLAPADLPDVQKDALKAQITALLEDHPAGLEPGKLARYSGSPQEVIYRLIAELQKYGLVDIKRGLVVLL